MFGDMVNTFSAGDTFRLERSREDALESEFYHVSTPTIEYGPYDIVRKVRGYGHIKYKSREYHIGSAFAGLCVALRFTTTDGLLDVYFGQHRIAQINLTN